MNRSNILGISAYYHDSACCLLQDGHLTAAVQEERLSRRKHDSRLPVLAFRECLELGNCDLSELSCVAYYEDSDKKLHRQLASAPKGLLRVCARRSWLAAKRPEAEIRNVLGYHGEIERCEHHEAHAASTFFFSGFPQAAILTVDGVGEWATTTYGHGDGTRLEIFEEVRFPNSLGLLYSTITSYLGFAVNDGEYKVMGLAPYGHPRYASLIRELVLSGPRGQFSLKQDCFDFTRDDRMYSDRLVEHLGAPPRRRGMSIRPFDRDLASSLQVVLEEILIEKVRWLHGQVPVDYLCLAGGVALNCVANARIARECPFKHIFVQPAAGDAGGCLGAAVLASYRRSRNGPVVGRLRDVFLGPAYRSDEVAAILSDAGIPARDYRGRRADLLSDAVSRLANAQVIGWFQGRMEFGPRALGARSILADPRKADMRERINRAVKKRESFRPFAPAVLDSEAGRYFDLDHPSPFMLETCAVLPGASLPAVTHVDGSARVQTVSHRDNPLFAALLERFHLDTGCPILLNTSFNLADEPIVCTPVDAIVTFVRSEMDALFVEDFVVDRRDLSPTLLAACDTVEYVPASISDSIYTLA